MILQNEQIINNYLCSYYGWFGICSSNRSSFISAAGPCISCIVIYPDCFN